MFTLPPSKPTTTPETPEPTEKKKREPKLVVNAELLTEIARLAGCGLTNEQFCYYFCYSKTGWEAKLRRHPEIVEAIKQGKAKALGRVTGKLMEAIEKGNLAAIMFYLKTQWRWREVHPDGDGDKDKPPFPSMTLTINDPIEAAKIYQQTMLGS